MSSNQRAITADYLRSARLVLIGGLGGILASLCAAVVVGPFILVTADKLADGSAGGVIEVVVAVIGSVGIAGGVGVSLRSQEPSPDLGIAKPEREVVGLIAAVSAFAVTLPLALLLPAQGAEIVFRPWWWPPYIAVIIVPARLLGRRQSARPRSA